MAGGTAVATHAAPPAANPTVDAKATDATLANVKPKVDAAALLAGGARGDSKLHVLLVEDDHSTLVFVKALLKSCGHTGTSRRAVRPRNLHTSASSTKPVAHHRRPFFGDIFWKRVFQCNG